MSDLVQRLQVAAANIRGYGHWGYADLQHEAVKRIEALEAALREIAAHSSSHDAIAERIARRALGSNT